MRKLLIPVAIPLVAILGLWLGSASGAARAHSPAAPAHHAVGVVRQSTPAVDTDNIQQGDQTTADAPSDLTAASDPQGTSAKTDGPEVAGDQGGDGSGGHQDPAGDVNHECTGNCQE
jgi:hypothetical protein